MPSALGRRVRGAANDGYAAQRCTAITSARDVCLIVGAVVINAAKKTAHGVTRWCRGVLANRGEGRVRAGRSVIFRRDGGLDRHRSGRPSTSLVGAALGRQILQIARSGTRGDAAAAITIGKAHVHRAGCAVKIGCRIKADFAPCLNNQGIAGAQTGCWNVDPAAAAVADLPCALRRIIPCESHDCHEGERRGGVTAVDTCPGLIVRGVAVSTAQQTGQLYPCAGLIFGRCRHRDRTAGGDRAIIDRRNVDADRLRRGFGTADAGIALIIDGNRNGVRTTRAVAVEIGIGRIDQTIKRGVDLRFGADDGERPRAVARQRGTRTARRSYCTIIDGNGRLHDGAKIVGIADRECVAVSDREAKAAVFGNRLVYRWIDRGSVVNGRYLNDEAVAGGQRAADTIRQGRATVCLIVDFDGDSDARIDVGICRCEGQAIERGVDIGKSAFQNQYFVAAWVLIRQPA